MAKTTIVLCLMGIFCMRSVQPNPVRTHKLLSKSELHEIATSCLEEVQLSGSIVYNILKTEIFPRDNNKYRDFLACSYKKQGFLSEDGTKLLYDNLFHFISHFYGPTEVQALKHCNLIRREDPGFLCFDTMKCIIDALKQLEFDANADIGIETNQVV
ncbi:uncharacterized protein LOC109543588 [Dendroctonus ponderosae]|uniref:Odorant-binding protein 26 n=1 Tax=Dendroctonus ponderosae TaxID=77166 RepID=M4VR77_DENPD